MSSRTSHVKDWMTQRPLTVGPDTSAVEAYERMRDHNVHRLPVIDASSDLIGIVTRSDIEGAASIHSTPGGWHEARFALAGSVVGDMMTRNPLTVSPEASMRQATALMLDHHLSGLPVVEGERLVGIITETDIFRMVVGLSEE